MIVPSMTPEELVKEIMKDYEIVQRKAIYLTDSQRRNAIKSKGKHVRRIFDYKSTNNNTWFIIVDYYKKEPTFVVVVYYLDKHGINGIMVNSDHTSLAHFTPHFLQRYNERFIKDVNFSKVNLLKRFISENRLGCFTEATGNKIFTRFKEGIGLGFKIDAHQFTLFSFKTFISNQMIHEGQHTEFIESGRIIEEYWNDMYKYTKKTAFGIV